jgi:hypothetical protein
VKICAVHHKNPYKGYAALRLLQISATKGSRQASGLLICGAFARNRVFLASGNRFIRPLLARTGFVQLRSQAGSDGKHQQFFQHENLLELIWRGLCKTKRLVVADNIKSQGDKNGAGMRQLR